MVSDSRKIPTSSFSKMKKKKTDLSSTLTVLEFGAKNVDNVIVLAGDINIRTGTYGYLHNPLERPLLLSPERKSRDPVLSKHWEQLINFLDNNLLTIINGRTISDKTGNCTFISSRGSSVVDYFIVSYSLLEHVVDLKVDNNPYSDHLPLTINMSNLSNLKRTKETVYPCFERYRWAPDNTSLFSQNLDNNQVSTDQNLDSLVNTFSKQILNAMLAADMRIKVRPGRPKSKPWYSRECYLAKKSAKASLTTFKETNTDVDRNIYVSNRKRYTTLINFNKKKYLQEKQELLKNARDSANFWKTIATLKDKSYIQGNITILEWQCFYNKLLSAETTIGSDLSTLSRIDPELYCEISITEITREISSLANEKACGADEIPNEALKTLPFEHLVTLKNIFNRIINSGSYPLIWSKSIIHPIFKSGDRDNPSNYRGIALISNLSKLFTSILKSRLRNWIEGRSIIPENQAGFRKGYSCQDHIFTLLSLIQLTLRRKRRKLYAFFVDLKKAFDTVPHSLLWSKLGELGLDFRFVNLIRNYFEQMTTTVRWNGLFTEPIKIRSGVLQGEPLSPYLFILFVTDLINIFNDSTLPGIYLPNFGTVHLLMYADDIILIGESKINLQIKINMLKKYFETNHLTLNESKSKIMVFRNGGRPAKSDKWFWGDQLLTVTSKYLYLGYPLTTTISFSQVASYFKGKALAATGEVWKIMEKSRLNSFGSSMKLLDSIILSTLLYSAPIWANEKYKILDQIQNNYLRRLLNLPSNTPGYILRMETGRFSLGVTATKLILKFWDREVFSIIGRPPDLQSWIFPVGLEDHAITISLAAKRLTPGLHRRAKAKTSLEDDNVPIDDTTTKSLFTPQEKERKGTRTKFQDFDGIIGRSTSDPFGLFKLIKKFRPFFLKIFNRCLETGHFPAPWKLGDVILIPKKGGEDFLASHRPITMLPGLGKILERLILTRLSWRAERMCKAQPNQFGFRPCKSTIAALLKLKNTLSRSLDLFKSAILLSFDVKGAFDNVLHSSILRALRKSDCPKNVHDLIRSFLAHRSVRLSVNGCTVTRRVSKGCPQGSVLGLFLWNIVFDELLTLGYKNCVYPQAYEMTWLLWSLDREIVNFLMHNTPSI
ncbi:hypothetical protein LAZ67_14002510 [Cordylochernes scorpioides]|uniref:Reverse transcriptase domain-containing protein n=1 Tax=Cordylochernes scorpioides TaxID=51811 RepID=A0ABY6L912_9ARAC|nr:hypothetical protein LAZ67_14002510 [Cordylochernes scorpioides]